MQPYSIIGAPYEVWIAPAGTAFPALDDAPADPWALLGVNGTRSLDEDGVTVTHGQTINQQRAAGATGPLKAFRTEENLTIAFNLIDLTVETYRYVLNGATITDTPAGVGVVGTRAIGLSRGFAIVEYALLARGVSPYDDELLAQYEVPRVYESAEPAPQFTKGQAAMLAAQFTAMEDLDAVDESERFGRFVAADAPATA